MFMISNIPLTFATYVLRLNPNTLDIQKNMKTGSKAFIVKIILHLPIFYSR